MSTTTKEILDRLVAMAAELGRLQAQRDATPTPPVVYRDQVSARDIEAMLLAMRTGRKIDAIKHFRGMTGYGLAESKLAIERHWPFLPEIYPTQDGGK